MLRAAQAGGSCIRADTERSAVPVRSTGYSSCVDNCNRKWSTPGACGGGDLHQLRWGAWGSQWKKEELLRKPPLLSHTSGSQPSPSRTEPRPHLDLTLNVGDPGLRPPSFSLCLLLHSVAMFVPSSGSQTASEPPGELVKRQIPGLHPQFLISKTGVRPENLCF